MRLMGKTGPVPFPVRPLVFSPEKQLGIVLGLAVSLDGAAGLLPLLPRDPHVVSGHWLFM